MSPVGETFYERLGGESGTGAVVAEHLDAVLREAGVADADREVVTTEVAGLEDAVLNR